MLCRPVRRPGCVCEAWQLVSSQLWIVFLFIIINLLLLRWPWCRCHGMADGHVGLYSAGSICDLVIRAVRNTSIRVVLLPSIRIFCRINVTTGGSEKKVFSSKWPLRDLKVTAKGWIMAIYFHCQPQMWLGNSFGHVFVCLFVVFRLFGFHSPDL